MNVIEAAKTPAQNGGSRTLNSNQLDMEQFLVLLTVQLATQNPLEPMSDRDFFAQLAQLGTVQGIDSLKSTAEASQMAGLIGKKVTASRTGGGAMVDGTVERVFLQNGEYFMMVKEGNGGQVQIQASQIVSIGA